MYFATLLPRARRFTPARTYFYGHLLHSDLRPINEFIIMHAGTTEIWDKQPLRFELLTGELDIQ